MDVEGEIDIDRYIGSFEGVSKFFGSVDVKWCRSSYGTDFWRALSQRCHWPS